MRAFLLLLLTLTLVQLPAQAQVENQEPAAAPVADWLVEFSNLPRNEREQYLRAFNNAKIAYQQGQWVACIGYLADCEMIFRKNPNIWNLRACCLMEQKYFEEAAEELQRVRKAMPDDPVTIMNLANLHLACGRYQEGIDCIHELRRKLPYETPEELLYVLDFREFLCHIRLGQIDEAKALVKGLSPISDTPLYYYSQAVFALTKGNRIEASRNLRIAGSIFSKGSSTVPYQRALELSGVADMQPAARTEN